MNMSISSINNPSAILQAEKAYNNMSAQKASLGEASEMDIKTDIKAAESFHSMVNKNFNSFAKMSAQNIMAIAKQAQNGSISSTALNNSGMASKLFSNLPKALLKDEEVRKRAIIGEASLTEVIAATSEAKVVLQVAVATRNKVHEAFVKIMDMPV